MGTESRRGTAVVALGTRSTRGGKIVTRAAFAPYLANTSLRNPANEDVLGSGRVACIMSRAVTASPDEQGAPEDARDAHAALALRARQERQVGGHQRFVERITLALGRPRTLYVTLLSALAWIAWNLASPILAWPFLDPPPFSRLQAVVGLASLLMTTMVLTTQNRQARHAEQRAHLDLEVNILAEKKIAKLIALIEELRRDMPNVHDRPDLVAEKMTHALDARAVISALEENMGAKESPKEGAERATTGDGGPSEDLESQPVHPRL